MAGYSILSLSDIIEEKGEDFCREILSSFSCPKNGDVERFLTKRSAIDFAKQGISQTFWYMRLTGRKMSFADILRLPTSIL